jgi:hypothetical protein
MSSESVVTRKYVNSATAAEALGVARTQIQKWAKEPWFPGFSIGGPIGSKGAQLRVDLEALISTLMEHGREEAAEAAARARQDLDDDDDDEEDHRRRSTVAAESYQPLTDEDQFAAFLANTPTDLDSPDPETPANAVEFDDSGLDEVISSEEFSLVEAKNAGIIG